MTNTDENKKKEKLTRTNKTIETNKKEKQKINE